MGGAIGCRFFFSRPILINPHDVVNQRPSASRFFPLLVGIQKGRVDALRPSKAPGLERRSLLAP